MKKLTLIGAAVVLAASFTSCKKPYTCECTSSFGNFTYDLGKIKKKDAKAACDAAGNSWVLIGGTCTAKAK